MQVTHPVIVKAATVKLKWIFLQWSVELNTSTCTIMYHPSE